MMWTSVNVQKKFNVGISASVGLVWLKWVWWEIGG